MRRGWPEVSEGGKAQTEKKVENIGNSYFPALAGPLFAPREGRLYPAGIPREGQKI